MKTRFIIAGTGNRGLGCFGKGLLGWPGKGRPEFPQHAELTAAVDANLTRGRAAARELRLDIPVARTVPEAQRQAPADWCIVTTPDFTHRQVVVDALEAGLHVLVDKPLATSAWECDLILQAMEGAGRQVIVGHNYRYNQWIFEGCRLARQGAIGRILHVEAGEILSYSHGGDYFHRWHSDFSKSAGLLNHKCCHHLDIICWILDDEPVEVSAWGRRSFYRERPDLNHGPTCRQCPITSDCPHYYDMDKWDGIHRRIYGDAEAEDGYVRDRCVFSDRHTINDQEQLAIRFAGGAIGGFTQVAFAPKEYAYYSFTGTEGRLEMQSREPNIRIYRRDGRVEEVAFDREAGEHGHGGADVKLIADILGLPGSDPLQRAHPREARRAVLIADLANRSIAAGGRPFAAHQAGKDFPPPPPRA